jgi:hypothetical protein
VTRISRAEQKYVLIKHLYDRQNGGSIRVRTSEMYGFHNHSAGGTGFLPIGPCGRTGNAASARGLGPRRPFPLLATVPPTLLLRFRSARITGGLCIPGGP